MCHPVRFLYGHLIQQSGLMAEPKMDQHSQESEL